MHFSEIVFKEYSLVQKIWVILTLNISTYPNLKWDSKMCIWLKLFMCIILLFWHRDKWIGKQGKGKERETKRK